ncbi:MAG: DUF3786 domain-containing protein [Deltaproteobacteria bacterium]|nr:DUF3786 domain-containing protein [Deltaproteobacteria bacterium]MBW2067401.1 DUF3786 domain-containing protein [Deltaproteobacteria bacterium]
MSRENENYFEISLHYLSRALARDLEELAAALPGRKHEDKVVFKAFASECRLAPEGITLDGKLETGPKSIIISMYALNVPSEPWASVQKWISFRELPNTMPYWGAFRANAEEILIPHVHRIRDSLDSIVSKLDGYITNNTPGDVAVVVFPLPKVPLLYIFYLADDEFPAEAKCLFPAGVDSFMPSDVLADLAEHTSRLLIELAE